MKRALGLVMALSFGLLPACDDGGGGGGGDAGPVGQGGAGGQGAECVRDPARIAEADDCFLDQDCPCGAHCALGRCAAACETAADCDGDGVACDAFGRCRAAAVASLPAMTRVPRSPISLDTPAVDFVGADTIREIRLQGLADRAPGPIRLEVRDGSELGAFGPGLGECDADAACEDVAGATRCVDGECRGAAPPVPADELWEIECRPGSWSRECNYAADELAPTRLRVRALGAQRARPLVSTLAVYAGNQRLTVGLHRKAAVLAPPIQRPGVYRGHLWPVAAGLAGGASPIDVDARVAGIRVPVDLRVYETGARNAFTVSMSSRVQALFGDESLAGTISLNNDSEFILRLPPATYMNAGDGGAMVVAQAESAPLRWRDTSISGEIAQTFFGVTGEARPLAIRWRLSVTRIGDTQGGAPAVPAPVALPDVAAAAGEPPLDAPRDDLEWSVDGAPSLGAQQILCGALNGRLTQNADNAALDVSGDLRCGDGPMLAFPALGAFDATDVGPLLRACGADAERDTLGDDAPTCVDAGRFKQALNVALRLDRARGLGAGDDPDPLATALGHRLIQQWLGLHQWVLDEARNAGLLKLALDGGGVSVDVGLSRTNAFTATDAAWSWVLHPRVAVALAAAPREALRAPDYRGRLGWAGESLLTHEQPLALPVTMLRAMRADVAVMRDWLQDGLLFRDDAARPDDARRLVKQAWLVLALSHGMYRNATQGNPTDWEAEWATETAAFGGVVGRLVRELDALDSDRNPLGVEDEDLPLPRVGGQDDDFERYWAASDPLVGDGGLARGLVDDAQDALDDVRGTWLALLQRDWDQAAQEEFYRDRLRWVHTHYGEMIWGLCAQPNWNSVRVGDGPGQEGILDLILDAPDCTSDTDCAEGNDRAFDAFRCDLDAGRCVVDIDSCFLDATQVNCRFDRAAALEQLSVADLGYEACLLGSLRRRLGDEVSSGNSAVDGRLDALFRDVQTDEPFLVNLVEVIELKKSVFGKVGQVISNLVEGQSSQGCDPAPCTQPAVTAAIADARDDCETRRQATVALRPKDAPNSCASTDECPTFQTCASGACEPLGAEGRPPTCYVGALGVSALAITAAAKDVEIAQSALAEHVERYDVVMRSCLIRKLSGDKLEAAVADHHEAIDTLSQVKLAADLVANVASGVKDAGGLDDNFFSAGAQAAGAAVEAAAKSVSDVAEFEMADAEREHERNMQRLQNDADNAVCANDAEMELVGARTSTLAVERASLDLAGAVADLTYQKYSIGAAIAEGAWTLKSVRDNRVAPIATNYWLNEDVERYHRKMRIAQRAVYLGLRAQEYGLQQVLSDTREEVLAARNPAELEDVLDDLAARTRSGQVAGGAPQSAVVVVSLRDHLLRLGDEDGGVGARNLPSGARVGALLTDPKYEVFDSGGRYLGQEIPFRVFPRARDTSAAGEASQGGVEVLASRDCAERVWSVNASVQGEQLMIDSMTARVDVNLRKQNTFASQWCRAPEGASPYQVASIRPEHNLFIDPLGGPPDDQGAGEAYLSSAATGYSDARLDARMNLTQPELEDLADERDNSTELAGRGLYGEYALFFPAETLTDDLRARSGLDLGRVEDILIRFEYVSVAKPRR